MQDPNTFPQVIDNGGKPAWRVKRVDDVDTFNAQGPQKIKRVTVALADGSTFTRDYPLSSFDADRVQADVDEHAAEIYSVLGLQSSTMVP